MNIFKKRKLTLQDGKKLINFLNVRENEEEDERMTELIDYAIKLIYNKNLSDFEDGKKQEIIGKTLDEVNYIIDKYTKTQEAKKENNFLYIYFKNKEYKSNPLNISIFYKINDKMITGEKIEDIIEYTLIKLFDGVLSYDKLEELKEEDYITYEILCEDCANLIYKTLEAAMKITSYKNPLEEEEKEGGKIGEISKKIDNVLNTYETDIYSIMLQNFSIMPEQVNKETAITILNLINSLKASQIKKEIKDEINKIKNNSQLAYSTKLEALEAYLLELGGD